MRYFLFGFVIFQILVGCTQKCLDQKTAISIGEHTVSYAETKIEFEPYRKKFEENKNTSLPIVTAEKWLEGFINDQYLVAEAIKLGYLDDKINKEVDHLEKLMIASMYGAYADSFVYRGIEVTNDEVEEAFIKSQDVYDIERFEFKSRQEMYDLLGKDTIIKDANEFYKIAENIKDKGLFISTKSKFPYLHFPGLQTILDTLSENSVSVPFIGHDGPYMSSIYIVYKKKGETQEQGQVSAYELKESLKKTMLLYKQQSVFYNKIKNFLKRSDYRINETLAYKIYNSYMHDDSLLSNTSEFLKGIENEIILTYSIDGKIIEVPVHEFIYSRSATSTIDKPDSFLELKKEILDLVLLKYFYEEAKQNGYTDDKNYIASKNCYIYRKLKFLYIQDSINSKVSLSDEDLLEVYNQQSDYFKDGTIAEIGLLYFKNKDDALQSTYRIRSNRPEEFKEDSIAKEVWDKVIKWDLNVHVARNNSRFTKEITDDIFSMKDQYVTEPYECKGEIFIVLKKGETGSYQIPFNEVEKDVKNIAKRKKEQLALKEKTKELETLYKPKIKKDILKYLGYDL